MRPSTHTTYRHLMFVHHMQPLIQKSHTFLVLNYHLAQLYRTSSKITPPPLPHAAATQTAAHTPIIDESLIQRFTKSLSHFLEYSLSI